MKKVTHQFSIWGFQKPIKRLKITDAQKAEARIAINSKDQVKSMRILSGILDNIERNL